MLQVVCKGLQRRTVALPIALGTVLRRAQIHRELERVPEVDVGEQLGSVDPILVQKLTADGMTALQELCLG